MYSITKFGECAKHLCVIDEEHNTVTSCEDWLVFDFNGQNNWSFNTKSMCVFITGRGCTFKTGSGCTFETGTYCNFKTGDKCTFSVWNSCTFKVGYECVLVRRDVFETLVLPAHVTYMLNGFTIKGGKVNTKEWVENYMNNEEGLELILKSEEYIAHEVK